MLVNHDLLTMCTVQTEAKHSPGGEPPLWFETISTDTVSTKPAVTAVLGSQNCMGPCCKMLSGVDGFPALV